MNFATWKAVLAPRQEFQCFILNVGAFCTGRCTSPLNDPTLDFCTTILNHVCQPLYSPSTDEENIWTHIFICGGRSPPKHRVPFLPGSHLYQRHRSLHQWHITEDLASQYVALYSVLPPVLFVGWLTKRFPPVKQLNDLMLFPELNSNEVVCFLWPELENVISSDVNCIITFELWLCFSQT